MSPLEVWRLLSKVSFLAHSFKIMNKGLHSSTDVISQISLIAAVTAILLLLLVVLGPHRRCSKSALAKGFLFISYTMTTYLIVYAMSLMLHPDSSLSSKGSCIVWAILLMMVFASVDSFCAYSLIDNEQWRRYNWQFAFMVCLLLILIYPYYESFTKPGFTVLVFILFVMILLKVHSKNQSLAASSRYALEKSGKILLDYMKLEEKAFDTREVDPVSMKGYGYLLQGEELLETKGFADNDRLVTLEKVWNCDGKFLSSDNDGSNHIKDLCLSFALFKILQLRYASYKLPREVHEKMSRLIRCGLLEREGDNYHERVFRVVEDELAFLFDLFYTKFHMIFQPKRYHIRKGECSLIVVVVSLEILGLFVENPGAYEQGYTLSSREKAYFCSVIIFLGMFGLVEIIQFSYLHYTRWAKVMNVCNYVKHDSWRTDRRKEKHVVKIWQHESPQPWERKLHQYSLLECYTYRPCKLLANKFMFMFINWYRDGQKKDHPIGLSGEVKKVVLDRVKDIYNTRLENGLTSLRLHDVTGSLLWACKLESQTEVMMVWHIATAMCEGQATRFDSEETTRNARVAISLSKYLAYLVGFAPRLLPDHPYMTESLFDQMIMDARHLFKGCKTLRQRIEKLRGSSRGWSEPDSTTLDRGAALGNCLLNEIRALNLIWAILADFWVEMVLCVALSNEDVTAHVEQLANGGEFVTHLWALLYHAGIKRVKRPKWRGEEVSTLQGSPVMLKRGRDLRRFPSA